MNPAKNHGPLPKFALWSPVLDSVPQMFRPFGSFPPATPFSPPSGPTTGSFLRLRRKSNFLEMVLDRLGGAGPNVNRIPQALAKDWQTRPSPLDPVQGPGPGAEGVKSILAAWSR